MTKASRTAPSGQDGFLPSAGSSRVVIGLFVLGAAVTLLLRVNWEYALAPAAAAVFIQWFRMNRRAWRSRGVERAFVMESAAISFYVSVAAVFVCTALRALGVVGTVDAGTMLIGVAIIDSVVRIVRTPRFA